MNFYSHIHKDQMSKRTKIVSVNFFKVTLQNKGGILYTAYSVVM